MKNTNSIHFNDSSFNAAKVNYSVSFHKYFFFSSFIIDTQSAKG